MSKWGGLLADVIDFISVEPGPRGSMGIECKVSCHGKKHTRQTPSVIMATRTKRCTHTQEHICSSNAAGLVCCRQSSPIFRVGWKTRHGLWVAQEHAVGGTEGRRTGAQASAGARVTSKRRKVGSAAPRILQRVHVDCVMAVTVGETVRGGSRVSRWRNAVGLAMVVCFV